MDGPIVREGAVAFENGRILAVGKATEINRAHPDAETHDAGDSIVLPGLVNAHTHLELSMCGADASYGGSFVDWILSLPEKIARGTRTEEQVFGDAVRRGVAQCLKFGVTTVGDITQRARISRAVLRESPVRAVSYGEVIGLAKRRFRFRELLGDAIDLSTAGPRLRVGLQPHAPYTVELPDYVECV